MRMLMRSRPGVRGWISTGREAEPQRAFRRSVSASLGRLRRVLRARVRSDHWVASRPGATRPEADTLASRAVAVPCLSACRVCLQFDAAVFHRRAP